MCLPVWSFIPLPQALGNPWLFDCHLCPWIGEFEPCLGGVGNLNQKSLSSGIYTFYLLIWRYLKLKSSQHMAQKERSTRKLLALILEKGRSNPHLCQVLVHNFGPGGGGRNLNEPVLKNLSGWRVTQEGGYLREHVEAFNWSLHTVPLTKPSYHDYHDRSFIT